MNQRNIIVRVRLSEEEKKILEHSAEICGLSQAEYLRQLCKGITPQPQPPKEFWGLLDTLYCVHAAFKECIEHFSSAADKCKEIELFVLRLQEGVT